MPSVRLIYASTSGHTEYVAEQVRSALEGVPGMTVTMERAERVSPQDLPGKEDLLILAASTWNTGNVEGQLNPHMHHLVHTVFNDLDFQGRRVAVIGLGDERYHYTCKAADHLEEFVKARNGQLVAPTLRIINEPYGQEEVVRGWITQLQQQIKPGES